LRHIEAESLKIFRLRFYGDDRGDRSGFRGHEKGKQADIGAHIDEHERPASCGGFVDF